MKLFARSFLALCCAATLAQADWVMVQKSTVDGQTKDTTTKIKGEQARVDAGGEMSVLLNASGMTMLMHAQKVMMKADVATMKALLESAKKTTGSATPAAKPKATGEKEKINGWDAEIYTWEGPLGKGRFWVSKDIPKYAELNAVSDQLGKAMGSTMAGMAPQASDFDGMVVKSEMTMMGKTVVTTLESVKEQELDAKEFVAPEGYTEVKMPTPPTQ